MKLYLIIIVFLFVHLRAAGQIEYDYHKGEFKTKVKPVLTGEFATIKIINVNTFRYKVEMAGKSINYVTPIPSELQAIFRLSEPESEKENTEEALKSIMKGAHGLKAFAPVVEASTFEEAMNNLSDASEEYLDIAKRIAAIKFTRVDLIDVSKQDWPTLDDMRQNLPAELSETQMKRDFINFNNFFEKIQVFYFKAKTAAKTSDDPAGNEAKVDEAYKLLKSGYEKLNEDQFLNLIRDVSILQQAIRNDNAFTVVSPPIQMDGDFVHFDVKTTPVQVNDLLNFTTGKSFPVDVPARGGWKADFSVGPAFSIGKNSRDDNYDLQYIESDSSKGFLVKSSNHNVLFPALVAMIHAYRRSGTQFNWGIMMGVGAGFKSTSDIDASYYFGPTFVLGKQQKIMFSGGASFLPVNRLKDIYKANTGVHYPVSNIAINDVTEKTIKTSFFFSISYNLTNRVDVK